MDAVLTIGLWTVIILVLIVIATIFAGAISRARKTHKAKQKARWYRTWDDDIEHR